MDSSRKHQKGLYIEDKIFQILCVCSPQSALINDCGSSNALKWLGLVQHKHILSEEKYHEL